MGSRTVRVDLNSAPMIGHWDVSPEISQCEFQIGSKLVYVEHLKSESELAYVAKAGETLTETWDDIANAVAFAEALSRPMLPEFWTAHDESGKLGPRLNVFDVRYRLDEPVPIYTVGQNPRFEYEYIKYAADDYYEEVPISAELPAVPDQFFLHVRRLGATALKAQTKHSASFRHAVPSSQLPALLRRFLAAQPPAQSACVGFAPSSAMS